MSQQLERVRGSIEVAIDLVDRAAGFVDDDRVLDELIRAANALAAAAIVLATEQSAVPPAYCSKR